MLAALAGAVLFAVHPVQVETVAWPSGTKDLLCGLFTLLAIQQYIAFSQSIGRRRTAAYLVTFASVVLAMLSKPTAVVAPLLLLALGIFMLGRSRRQLARELLPMFALMIPCAAVARWSQPATFSSPVPVALRPMIAVDAVSFYLRKLVAPLHLSPDYGRSPAAVLRGGMLYLSCTLPAVVTVAAAVLWRKGVRMPMIAGTLLLIPLLPVLGLQPFLYQYHSTVTDHYLYLSMFGVGLAFASVFGRLHGRGRRVALLVLMLLDFRTLLREPVWQNTRTLFANAVASDPNTFGNYDMLGFTYAHEMGRLARAGDRDSAFGAGRSAIDCYRHAIELNPLDVPARDNLARVELNLGDRPAAVEQMRAIIRLQPQLPADLRADPADLAARLREYSGDSVR